MNGNSRLDRTPVEEDRDHFVNLVREGYRWAEKAAGGPLVRFFSVGGFIVCLRFAGPGLIPQLTPALSHLEVEPGREPDLTVSLWDSVTTGMNPPMLLRSLIQLLCDRWLELLDARMEIRGYSGGRVRAGFHLGPNILSVLDTETNQAYYWVQDASLLPYYEKGSPLKTVFNWWTGSRRLQYVHAGAVGSSEGGVLLAGKGGTGKSTAALACLDAGLAYASDDYCLVAGEPSPYVYSLYNTVKLRGLEDIRRFPHLASLVSNPDRGGEEKLMIFLQSSFPERVIRGFPIRAVLLPVVTGGTKTRLVPTTPGAALKAIAPSTLFQLSGAGQGALRNISEIIRRVPSYVLELGGDISGISPVVMDLLSGTG